MAGKIIVSEIQTDNDNNVVIRANTGNVLFRVTDVGLDVANSVPSGSITSDMIADGTVIAADVADGSITTDKIADGNVTVDKIASGSITTDKIADANVTNDKIVSVANTKITGNITSSQIEPDASLNGDVTVTGNISTPGGLVTASSFSGDASSLTGIPAANLTGTLPAIDGSNLTGIITGKVLQMQYTNADTRASYSAPNTNTPTVMTPLTTSITPTSASSKILIMISMFVEGPQDVIYKLYRGGTVIGRNSSSTSRWSGTAVNNYDIDNANTPFMVTFNYVDSPATTSAISYSVRCQSSNAVNYTTYLNRCVNNAGADSTEVGMSCVTLMEVA